MPLAVADVVRVADAVPAHRDLSAEVAVLSHHFPRFATGGSKKPAKPTSVAVGKQEKNSCQ
jgi:hypothetical protein